MWFKEKHTKNLKNCQNYDRLNIGIEYLYWNQCLRMCPYGTYVLLGSLKHVLRGCKITKNALKELKLNDEYVQWCNMNWLTMSLSCVSVEWDSVFRHGYCCQRLMWSFLGSWKEFRFGEYCSIKWCRTCWSNILRGVDYLHVMCLSPCFHN